MNVWRALGLGGLVLALACSREEPQFPIRAQIAYSLTLHNKGSQLLRDSELRVFAPVKELANQRSESITASEPYDLLTDRAGNQTLRFLMTVPPWATRTISIRANVLLAAAPNSVPLKDSTPYLAPSRMVQSDNARVRAAALALGGQGSLDVARVAYTWVAANLSDPGLVREDRGALWALDHLSGDCTERAYLFSALARARGIPSRTLAGFVTDGDAVVHAGDYHNWAEFYVNNAWRIADPQKAEFDASSKRYVAMRIIDPGSNDLADAQRFVAFDPKLEIRMD